MAKKKRMVTSGSRRTALTALLSASSALAMTAVALPATAQTAPAADPAAQAAPPASAPQQDAPTTASTKSDMAQADAGKPAATQADIVVTGSRITASGFTAPTPTTVVGIEQLQQQAQPNIFDSLAQLPALQGSVGTTNARQNGNTSLGSNGLSALNLRGLGTIRTLTLLDGQRVVPAYITGIADVSQFPQLLIKRVDVVTGGASASWGSDAISGVVNFVTDTKFVGLKANVLGGISTYGDDKSALVQVAGGWAMAGDAVHVELAGEYFHNDGVPGGEVGGAQPNGRPVSYRSGTTSYALGAQPAGSPQYYAYPVDAQTTTLGRVGLITTGPLAGTAFGAGGGVSRFQYGANCVSNVCQGGQQDNYITTNTIDNPIRRINGYGRIGIDLAPTWEVYATVNYSTVKSMNTPIAYPRKPGNLTISCANPFLPTQITTACATAGITSFAYGTANANLPGKEIINTKRDQIRAVIGTDGSFDIGNTPIKFDAYYQHGANVVDVNFQNMTLNSRYNAAINATRNAAGQIVCASAVAVAEGCQPINIFTDAPVTAAQFAFIAPASQPFQHTVFKEDAASLSFNTSPLRDWAGDISLAFGVELRREAYYATADPYGNGVGFDTPNTATYPADPLLVSAGNNWFAGNYHVGRGSFFVTEGFIEAGVPLLDSTSLGKVNMNVAGRTAHYSTAGQANTWKLGGTWETPLSGLRLRTVFSRDLRAPNLSELFAAPQTANQPVINRATGNTVQVVVQTVGNPNLKPEIAYTFEAGFAYRPAFLPRFNLSVDYYNIRVRQAISTLTQQQTIDLCYNGNTAYCPNVSFTGTLGTAVYPFVVLQPFNLASLTARGIDIEASYQQPLGGFGRLTLRALATRALDLISDTGIAGQQVAQLAGNNTDAGNGVPDWKVYLSESLDVGRAQLSLIQRYVSPGKVDPNAIVCQTNCPASTVQHPTYNFNYIPGAMYLDVGGNFKVTRRVELYGKVDNVLNHRVPPLGGTVLYDPIGRIFRIGARLAL